MQKQYGDFLDFKESASFELPDFTITFLGQSAVEKPQYAGRVFTYFDYELKSADQTLIVSWSGGTGFVSPGNFEFLGKKWVLDNQTAGKIAIVPFEEYKDHSVELPVNKAY